MPQGSLLGPVLSNIFLDDLDDGAECTLSKFAGDKKLEGAVNTPEWCAAIQKDLNRVEKWTDRNMKFIKRKCQVLQLGKDNPIHQNRLEVERLQSNSAEKALGVLWTN